MAKPVDERIRRSRRLLLNQYAYLNGDGELEAEFPGDPGIHAARRLLLNQYAYLEQLEGVSGGREEAQPSSKALIDPVRLLRGRAQGQRLSPEEIEEIARNLHVELWLNREELWPGAEPTPLEIVDPEVALRAIGFAVDADAALGEYPGDDGVFEVAGVLDRANSRVQVSGHLGAETQLFTLAHELGHAVLHVGSGLHRDRALDGSAASHQSDRTETEANKFAASFLMPDRLVRKAFREAFDTDRFVPHEMSAFDLIGESLASRREKYRTRRDLARLLARADHYGGRGFKSLATRFRVSVETMAIRLEELNLVQL